jgi:hypothetical protein
MNYFADDGISIVGSSGIVDDLEQEGWGTLPNNCVWSVDLSTRRSRHTWIGAELLEAKDVDAASSLLASEGSC